MRPRTAIALGGLVVLLGGIAVFGLGVSSTGGALTETWASDTPRDNRVNHHAVGVGPEGDALVAPVAEVARSDVRMTDASCALVRLAPDDGSVRWRTGLPAGHCFTHALTEPTVADVDRDGRLEVVVATTEEALVAHDARTGTEAWRVPLSAYGYGRPTVANVTPAAGPEVVASDIRGGVAVVRGNGSVAWRFDANATAQDRPSVWAAPVVDDVDGDGRPNVLVGSNRGAVLLDGEGSVEWVHDGSADHVVAVQADDDDALEVFTAGTSALRAVDGATGTREWRRSLSGGRVRTAADGDGDGAVELYVGRAGGEVLALDAGTGETEWSTSISGDDDVIVPSPVLGDVDGDGGSEVIAVTSAGHVVVLDADSGAELARYERSVPIWTFATPADVDDDGRVEILVRYGDGRVVALDFESRTGVAALTAIRPWRR